MFKSLKSWINIPVAIKPYVKRTGTGSKEFGENINTTCYAEGKVQQIKNKDGKETVSHKQLYMTGTEVISELDNIVFESRETEIQAISYFYRNGIVDIKVVYL